MCAQDLFGRKQSARQVLAGPSVGQFFAELGADVIKAHHMSADPGRRKGKRARE